MLSVIIPALNEGQGLARCLAPLQPMRRRGVEVIVVDGGSDDDTVRIAAPLTDQVMVAPRGRAAQMNAGAAVAKGDILLFLHADTLAPEQADRLVTDALARSGRDWGRFDVRIDGRPWMLRLVALAMNWRSRLSGIATGDQTLFVRSERFAEIGGFPDQPLMEDIEICKKLRARGRPVCLREKVTTSGRRWEQRGVWRTILLMWRLRWAYARGVPVDELARAYR